MTILFIFLLLMIGIIAGLVIAFVNFKGKPLGRFLVIVVALLLSAMLIGVIYYATTSMQYGVYFTTHYFKGTDFGMEGNEPEANDYLELVLPAENAEWLQQFKELFYSYFDKVERYYTDNGDWYDNRFWEPINSEKAQLYLDKGGRLNEVALVQLESEQFIVYSFISSASYKDKVTDEWVYRDTYEFEIRLGLEPPFDDPENRVEELGKEINQLVKEIYPKEYRKLFR